MDLHMTVRTPHIVDEMGAGVVFGAFDLMTAMAGDWLGLNFPTLSRVFLDIGDIPMAAITGVGSMDRFGEFGHVDIFVTLQARGIIDTLQTVLSPPDLKLLLGQLKFLTEFQFLSGRDREKGKEE
jgi:hypothetical protein